MSNTAILTFEQSTSKWVATFKGQRLVASQNKQYVSDVIVKGLNGRARNLNVTRVSEEVIDPTVPQEPDITFTVAERFDFLGKMVQMVAKREMKAAVVVGEGGLGKTFTVNKNLRAAGLTEHSVHADDYEIGSLSSKKSFVVIKGYMTPKNLFRTLFENRNGLVVFDDCDSVLRDEVAANVLKGALDSYDKRIITWGAEAAFGESDLPKSFEFTGAVIFISNLAMSKVPQALISRAATADMSMTRTEVVDYLRDVILPAEDFCPEASLEEKNDAMEFVAKYAHHRQVRALNARSLIKVITNRRCHPTDWQRLSLSMMFAER